MSKEISQKIYETTDYSAFKKLRGNRDLRSVDKIIESIRSVGYIVSPICVNEKMEIIDGQNRLAALQILDLPVHYYIVKGIGIEEARQMNIGQTNWRPIDYIQSYAESGNPNYQRLLLLCEKHKEYAVQHIVGMIKNEVVVSGWRVSNGITDGTFEFSEKEYFEIEALFEYLDQVREPLFSVKYTKKRMAITAFAFCLRVKGVDKSRLVTVVQKNYPVMQPAIGDEQIVKELSDLYNKGIKNKIWFDVALRESKLKKGA